MINKGWSTFILQRMQQFMYLDLVNILSNEVIGYLCELLYLPSGETVLQCSVHVQML